jgi:hypothetical protein
MGTKLRKFLASKNRLGARVFCGTFTVIEKFLIFGGITTLLVLTGITLHRVDNLLDAQLSALKPVKRFEMSEKAVQVAEHIYEVKTRHADVTGLVILHFDEERQNEVQSEFKRSSKISGYENSVSGTCYAAYAKGAKWKVREKYIIDYSNNQGLTSSYIRSSVEAGVNAWNQALTSGNIFGTLDTEHPALGIDVNNPDGRNEIHFGYLSDPGVLAVTIVWGVFNGPEADREIFEFDQIFNEYYQWGNADSDPSLNDFQNTLTHELGHAAGERDIYESSCSHVTMYGYAGTGETKKRSLASEDIRGINALYGTGSGGSAGNGVTHSQNHGTQTNQGSKDKPMYYIFITCMLILFQLHL